MTFCRFSVSAVARRSAAALALACPLYALAQSGALPTSVADESAPVVELMPVALKHEAELGLTPQQQQALADFRRQAMPRRVALQQEIKNAKAELRRAVLDNAPESTRNALLERWLQAEREHAQMRMRCVAFMRETLSPQQMAQVQQLYLQALR